MPEPSPPQDPGRGAVPEQPDEEEPRPAAGADRNRLPADPLLGAVRRLARRRRQSLRDLLGPDLFVAYCNACVASTISLIMLERFCDEILGWHPRMLYGDAYDEAAFRPPDPP
jgi:hypothetical protein